MKKLLALALALIMVLSMGTVAFAASPSDVVDEGEGVYTVTGLDDLRLSPADRTIYVESKEGLLNLPELVNNWAALFSDGNGTTWTNYNNGKGADFYYDWTWNIKLEADIDFEGAAIAPIKIGKKLVFDGQNHTIKNAVITTDSATQNNAGLFDGADCGFKNLNLDNIEVTGSNVGNSCVGVLSGSCNKPISNITVTNSSVYGHRYSHFGSRKFLWQYYRQEWSFLSCVQ